MMSYLKKPPPPAVGKISLWHTDSQDNTLVTKLSTAGTFPNVSKYQLNNTTGGK